MRVESTVLSISWIPDESIEGALRAGFDLGVAHYDPPPPDRVADLKTLNELQASDRFRFANVVSGWVDVEGDRVVDAGYSDESGLLIAATRVLVASVGATFNPIRMPELRVDPVVAGSTAQFVQTVGGRTGVPLPRPVRHAPFVQWRAPLVWTTLALTIHADGHSEVELRGASAFPRHWVYDTEGSLLLKSGLTDQKTWVAHSFGDRTPWGDQDSQVVVAEAESALERQLSTELMNAGQRPEIRRLDVGATVTRQGEPGADLLVLLDGVLAVDVDGTRAGEVGPGAVLGERALLEGGRRQATLVATTPVRIAVADAQTVDLNRLRQVALGHGWSVDR